MTRRALLTVSATALAAMATGLATAPSSWATGSPTGATVCTGGVCTDTFTTTANANFTVPSGVTSVDVTVAGAAGGSYFDTAAQGGTTSGTLAVSAGASFTVIAGGAGAVFNGGKATVGGGGAVDPRSQGAAGTGGGGSFLFASDGTLLLAAGGGGGGWLDSTGGAGSGASTSSNSGKGEAGSHGTGVDQSDLDGVTYYADGGGGTQSAGGAAGHTLVYVPNSSTNSDDTYAQFGTAGSGPAAAGAPGAGGSGTTDDNGGNETRNGAGGGGGYYGGGGGAIYSGGGGGSGYAAPSVTDVVGGTGTNDAGNGYVAISYDDPAAVSLTVTGQATYGSGAGTYGVTAGLPAGATVTGTLTCTATTGGAALSDLDAATDAYDVDPTTCTGWTVTDKGGAAIDWVLGSVSLTVDPQPVDVIVTGKQTYGGSPSFKARSTPPQELDVDTSAVTCTRTTKGAIKASNWAGAYSIDSAKDATACSGATLGAAAGSSPTLSNYTVHYTGTFTVSKAKVTVTVDPLTVTKGTPASFTLSVTGLVGHDKLAGTPSYRTSMTKAGKTYSYDSGTGPVGTYYVYLGGLSLSAAQAKNYSLSFVTGRLFVITPGAGWAVPGDVFWFGVRPGSRSGTV